MKRMDTSLEMKDNSESALSTNKEAITTLGLRHGPDSYGRQQWGIFRNGRKLDGAMPRGAAVIQRMQALSGMIGRKASVGGFLSPPSNPRAQPWTGGGNCQAGTAGDKPEEGEDDVKSSCPLCPGRHTCYNGRDKGSRSREAPDPEMWIIQGTLAWRTSPVRKRGLKPNSPQEDRWGDSGEIQCRSNFLFTRGIRAVRGGPPWLNLFSRIHTLISVVDF
ncbi:hypothetical protein POTOM_062047 (chloroplast) [Populus tomentosa]|uniref:Uncharacterized protein n=1 Tax=Populus tomentosa TaxID=118781 RepID=A0A8X7XR28_POPTO|nr:hypothetical protein POTOM_062047 [Populus tomentosa]